MSGWCWVWLLIVLAVLGTAVGIVLLDIGGIDYTAYPKYYL